MKTTIKTVVLLLTMNLFIGCSMSEHIAYLEASCPSTKTNFDYGGNGIDSPDTKNRVQNNGMESDFFLSYSLGVGTAVPINDKFSFNPTIAISGKGNKIENIGFEDKLTSTYIDVPLRVNYKWGESKLRINGGLQPSILLGAKRIFSDGDSENSQKVANQFKTFEVAAIVGIGYHFDNGFGINFGYNHGLTNINKSNDNFGNDFTSRNRALRFGLSYTLKKNN